MIQRRRPSGDARAEILPGRAGSGRAGVSRFPAPLRWRAPLAAVRRLTVRFARARGGVAAIEFAMVAPFLITLYLGGFEISRYVKTARKVTYVANSVAQMLAQNTSGTVTDTDLHFFVDSAIVTFPDVLSNSYAAGIPWYQDIQTSMASVAFTPTKTGCTSGCTYKAKVVWNAGPNPRSCTTAPTSAADSAAPTNTTLPADSFGPGSLIVVDVVYTYRPVVATRIFSNMRIAKSVYIQPRYVGEVDYDDSSGTKGHSC